MKSKISASADQKRFWSEISEIGCIFHRSPGEIDHLFGGSARSNKTNIGHWAVICLCPGCHRLDKINRTSNEVGFYGKWLPELLAGDLIMSRKFIYQMQIDLHFERYGKKSVPDEIVELINNY